MKVTPPVWKSTKYFSAVVHFEETFLMRFSARNTDGGSWLEPFLRTSITSTPKFFKFDFSLRGDSNL